MYSCIVSLLYQPSVPIKWLAPETLDTLTSRKPTYNEKTDAWSYGITLWEMYSKGISRLIRSKLLSGPHNRNTTTIQLQYKKKSCIAVVL